MRFFHSKILQKHHTNQLTHCQFVRSITNYAQYITEQLAAINPFENLRAEYTSKRKLTKRYKN